MDVATRPPNGIFRKIHYASNTIDVPNGCSNWSGLELRACSEQSDTPGNVANQGVISMAIWRLRRQIAVAADLFSRVSRGAHMAYPRLIACWIPSG